MMRDPLNGVDKDMAKVLRAARRRGWTIERSGRGHPRLTWKGQTITCAMTPSDHRAIHNLRADMARIESGRQ